MLKKRNAMSFVPLIMNLFVVRTEKRIPTPAGWVSINVTQRLYNNVTFINLVYIDCSAKCDDGQGSGGYREEQDESKKGGNGTPDKGSYGGWSDYE